MRLINLNEFMNCEEWIDGRRLECVVDLWMELETCGGSFTFGDSVRIVSPTTRNWYVLFKLLIGNNAPTMHSISNDGDDNGDWYKYEYDFLLNTFLIVYLSTYTYFWNKNNNGQLCGNSLNIVFVKTHIYTLWLLLLLWFYLVMLAINSEILD